MGIWSELNFFFKHKTAVIFQFVMTLSFQWLLNAWWWRQKWITQSPGEEGNQRAPSRIMTGFMIPSVTTRGSLKPSSATAPPRAGVWTLLGSEEPIRTVKSPAPSQWGPSELGCLYITCFHAFWIHLIKCTFEHVTWFCDLEFKREKRVDSDNPISILSHLNPLVTQFTSVELMSHAITFQRSSVNLLAMYYILFLNVFPFAYIFLLNTVQYFKLDWCSVYMNNLRYSCICLFIVF